MPDAAPALTEGHRTQAPRAPGRPDSGPSSGPATETGPPERTRRGWRALAGTGLALAALAAVFLLYLRPGFLVKLADAIWACF